MRVWDIRSGVWRLIVQGHRASVKMDISGTENFLVTAGVDRHVAFWKYDLL